jgi:hypothetical protein
MANDINDILAKAQPEQRMTVNPSLVPEPEVEQPVVNVNAQKVMADNVANIDLIREATQKGIDVPTLLAEKKAAGAQVVMQPSAYDTMVQGTQNNVNQSFPADAAIQPQVSVQQPQPQVAVMPQESIAPDPIAVADKVAQRKVQLEDEIANEVAQASSIQDIENQVQKETADATAKIDDEIKAIGPQQLGDYFNQGDIFQKLLAGVALGLGGFYAGYTGKENPALQIMTKAVEGNQALRKLKSEERNKIIAAQADLLAQKLKAWEADPSRNPMARIKMQEARLGLEKTSSEIRKNLADTYLVEQKARAGGAAVGLRTGQQAASEAIDSLPEDQRERAIFLPNNKIALASTKKQKEEFDKFQAETLPALQAVGRVESLLKDFNKFTDLETRNRIESELVGLAGNLRLSYLGPGAMTDAEYERLRSAIGQPGKIFTLMRFQKAKLDTVEGRLKGDVTERLRQAGIKADVNQFFGRNEDEQINELTRQTIAKAKARGLPVPSEKTIREAWKKGRGE